VLHRGLIACCAVLTVAAPAWAQQPSSTPPDPARPQVQAFEMVLRGAVDLGGQRFAQRAAEVVPSVYLAPSDTPTVTGFPIREKGLFIFEIQVPGILQTGLRTYLEYLNRTPRGHTGPDSGGAKPVAAGGVSADGAVAPDPMTASPLIADPDRAYSLDVRAALMDAMIDSSAVLPLGADDMLVIVASGNDPVGPNPLYRLNPKKLILSVRNADLTEFRQGRITRDEALQRIKESYF
jgi:hypothetical protein